MEGGSDQSAPGSRTHVDILRGQEAPGAVEQVFCLIHGALGQAVGLQVTRRPALLVRLTLGT